MRRLAVLAAALCLWVPSQADGYLYVGDANDGSIARFDATTGAYLDRQAMPGFGNPAGMAFGGDGNLYVADQFNGAIDRFNGATGAFMDAFVPQGSGSNPLFSPNAVAFGPDGNLYVGDFGSGGQSFINRYNGTTGALIDQFVAPGDGPFGGIYYPTGMTFGPDGKLYVSDGANGIDRFDPMTHAFDQFVPIGNPPSPLSGPESLTFGADGNLYVADAIQSSVLRFDGSTGAYLGEFVPSAGGPLVQPIGMEFGPDHNLYVTDGEGRVARFDGASGAYLGDFVPIGGSAGPLVNPQYMAFSPVPEPASLAVLGLGALAMLRRRSRR
ncbi:MAG TPA: SMP-30/gluconolactonase/LRE family protein [Fimbriimonadaceae bacterium]|nr:SMP-30/gluconolactonase/LRE family protein [Fimbriimonadaceae bacterium]